MINKKDVCIVIPIYKDNSLNNPVLYDEYASIDNTITLMKDYDIYLLCNNRLDTSFYDKFLRKNVKYINYEYSNRPEYSNMCLSYQFYDMFSKYKYMLICQTDAWIFKDELLYWCSKGYDYIGALGLFSEIYPKLQGNWGDENVGNIYDYKYLVMNGGFSLRNIKSMHDLCYIHRDKLQNETFNEDCVLFWNYKDEFTIPPLEEAIKFSAENQTYAFYPKYYDKLPFGCHTRKTRLRLLDIFK